MPPASDAQLRRAYAHCSALQRRHDPVYHVATRLLPRDARHAVHALYGFLRGADEIVDAPARLSTPEQRRAGLDAWHRELTEGTRRGHSDHPVIAALVDAGARHALPLDELTVYMDSMRVDCDGRVRLRTRDELDRYMNGSAATVGRLMATLIGVPAERREDVARLGLAFQLTNFLRDVREDFAMDRVYLWGLDEAALRAGRPTALPPDEIARARDLFASSRSVLTLCTPRMRPGIWLACAVYQRLLGRIERRALIAA